jgi:hypothetical protein
MPMVQEQRFLVTSFLFQLPSLQFYVSVYQPLLLLRTKSLPFGFRQTLGEEGP